MESIIKKSRIFSCSVKQLSSPMGSAMCFNTAWVDMRQSCLSKICLEIAVSVYKMGVVTRWLGFNLCLSENSDEQKSRQNFRSAIFKIIECFRRELALSGEQLNLVPHSMGQD